VADAERDLLDLVEAVLALAARSSGPSTWPPGHARY
jgi:hypothetical protein